MICFLGYLRVLLKKEGKMEHKMERQFFVFLTASSVTWAPYQTVVQKWNLNHKEKQFTSHEP